MSLANKAEKIIRTLQKNPFYADCPHCERTIPLANAGLFYLDDFSMRAEKLYRERLAEIEERKTDLRERPKNISRSSELGARAVNIGFVLERIAPSMKGFPFARNDCRSLFEPIDYLIFDGLTKTGSVRKIVFSDIKTGDASLGPSQREIRELVGRKRVSFSTYPVGSK